MARELEDYRNNMEILNTRFPGKDMLGIADVQAIFGIRSRDTVLRHFPMRSVGRTISKATLARMMCGEK